MSDTTADTIRWLDEHTETELDLDLIPLDERPCSHLVKRDGIFEVCGGLHPAMLTLGPDLRGHYYRMCSPCWRGDSP